MPESTLMTLRTLLGIPDDSRDALLTAIVGAVPARLLLLLGGVREWRSAGTVFGHLLSRPILPMAGMPAGGFIVLGVLCAVWRALAKKQKDYLTSEARGLMAVYRQREGEPQDEQ